MDIVELAAWFKQIPDKLSDKQKNQLQIIEILKEINDRLQFCWMLIEYR
jgi:excinuclease ABC subunit A